MQEWDYNELREYIDEVFNNSINDGLNILQAGGRCLYEFANVIEEGETEKTIFLNKIFLCRVSPVLPVSKKVQK